MRVRIARARIRRLSALLPILNFEPAPDLESSGLLKASDDDSHEMTVAQYTEIHRVPHDYFVTIIGNLVTPALLMAIQL